MNAKRIFILIVISLFLISCNVGPKENSDGVNKQPVKCMPDIYMYQGYDEIMLITASIDQSIKLAEKNIVGLGGIEHYKKWRETEEGCGIMYYFFEVTIDDGISNYIRVEFSDIYKNNINNLTVEYLYKAKDYFIQSKINKGEFPINFTINVVDGDYSVASTVRQNTIDYLNFKKGK